jgi:hypothetical protein
MKCSCDVASEMFVIELESPFVDLELMNALGIVYPQFWMEPNGRFFFSLHFNVIKKHYCELKRVKPSLDQVVKPLNVNFLDM